MSIRVNTDQGVVDLAPPASELVIEQSQVTGLVAELAQRNKTQVVTQAQYDAMPAPRDPNMLYIIVG